jgi:hypothetical protein
MKLSNIELPSDKKFGFFFSGVFFLIGFYFYFKNNFSILILFFILCIIFLAITLTKAEKLHPLNKLWMKFGQLLGVIISPIIMGIIFFGLFTPMSIFMRFFGRDELHLSFKIKKSFWISRQSSYLESNSFKNQF